MLILRVGPNEGGEQEANIYEKPLQCLVPKTNCSTLRDKDITS